MINTIAYVTWMPLLCRGTFGRPVNVLHTRIHSHFSLWMLNCYLKSGFEHIAVRQGRILRQKISMFYLSISWHLKTQLMHFVIKQSLRPNQIAKCFRKLRIGAKFAPKMETSQFHQHFMRAFFIRKSFRPLFSSYM